MTALTCADVILALDDVTAGAACFGAPLSDESMLFEDAKPGDVVAVPYSDGDVKARVVAKVTATQVVLENGDRYRRDDGHGIKVQGHAKPWTEEHDARHRRYVAGVRLREAAVALHRLTSVGCFSGPGYMPAATDVPAALALADAIEKYVASVDAALTT